MFNNDFDDDDLDTTKILADLNEVLDETGPIRFTAQGVHAVVTVPLAELADPNEAIRKYRPQTVRLGLDVCVITFVVLDWDGAQIAWHTIEAPASLVRLDPSAFMIDALTQCMMFALAKAMKRLACEYYETNSSEDAYHKFVTEFGDGITVDRLQVMVGKMREHRVANAAALSKWELLAQVAADDARMDKFFAWLEAEGHDVLTAADHVENFVSIEGAL